MWSPVNGFVITNDEIAVNEERQRRHGYAPKLNCPHCNGLGFVHEQMGSIIRWDKAIPCRACMPEARQRYEDTKYGKSYTDEDFK